jgi:RNA polymerase sigma-70 factor (ECF subfamily)
MAELDDVIARARDGDESAFVVLFRTYQPLVLRYLRGVAPDLSDDLASDVWLDVVRGLTTFTGDESGFRGWLFTIARRRVIDLRRARGRRPEVLSAEPPDDTLAPDAAWEVDQSLGTERAIALISQLPAQQAEVVLLRVVAGLDVPAVAAIVGRRAATVRVQSHRGLRRLAEILAQREAAVTDPTWPAM